MDEKYTNRCKSFINSLDSFAEVRNRDTSDEFVLSGAIQKFSITFDLAWKVMKDIIIIEYGKIDFATGSPRDTLRNAKECGLIDDDTWIDMMVDRNILTHDYDGTLAKEKIYDIVNVYLPLMEKFKGKLEVK